jgi:hypothetical protein
LTIGRRARVRARGARGDRAVRGRGDRPAPEHDPEGRTGVRFVVALAFGPRQGEVLGLNNDRGWTRRASRCGSARTCGDALRSLVGTVRKWVFRPRSRGSAAGPDESGTGGDRVAAGRGERTSPRG